MDKNVDGLDRTGRIVTGTTQKCPINEAVGIDTTEREK